MGIDGMSTQAETYVQRLRRNLRELGPRYTAQNVIKTIAPERVLRANTMFIVAADLRDWPRDQTAHSKVRWATETDSPIFAQTDISVAEFLHQLAAGARIAIYEHDGEILGYFIYRTSDIKHHPWLRYRLAPDLIWHRMAWTAPQHRGKRVHTIVQNFALFELSRQGYVGMLASVDAVNTSSLRASIKECSVVGSVSFIRSLDLTAVWVNGRVRFGTWRSENPLVLASDLFQIDPNRRYGPVKTDHFERLINRRW